jgi:hypothetical protein
MFSGGQFLGELREGLPALVPGIIKSLSRLHMKDWKDGTRDVVSGSGSDVLNVEFGWKPLINDLTAFGRALMRATEQLSGNGERVHRSYGAPPLMEATEYRGQGNLTNWLGSSGHREAEFGLPTLPLGNGTAPNGEYYVLRTRRRNRWFEGEFTNFFKLGFDPNSYLSRLDQLVDPSITPATLWELAPWSWLVDWHLRIGDTIKANELASSDRLVMHYGYAMEHETFRDLVSIKFTGNDTAPNHSLSVHTYWEGLPSSVSYVSTTEYKSRIRANPYGFRVGGTTALTEGQLGILGALGLTRLK